MKIDNGETRANSEKQANAGLLSPCLATVRPSVPAFDIAPAAPSARFAFMRLATLSLRDLR